MYLHRASWHSSATLTEVFPCFFLSCKANARVNPAKTGHGPHSSKIVVLFCVLFVLFLCVYCFVCKCVLYCCHRAATQLQLTDMQHYVIKPTNAHLYIMLCHILLSACFDRFCHHHHYGSFTDVLRIQQTAELYISVYKWNYSAL